MTHNPKILISIRHAPKAFANGIKKIHPLFKPDNHAKLYPLDPPVASKELTQEFVTHVVNHIQKHFPAKVWQIVSSPFDRTTETSYTLLGQLLLSGEFVAGNINFDLRVSEYLGHHSRDGKTNSDLFSTSTNLKILKSDISSFPTEFYDYLFSEKIEEIRSRTDLFVDDWLNGNFGQSAILVSHNLIRDQIEKCLYEKANISIVKFPFYDGKRGSDTSPIYNDYEFTLFVANDG